MSTLPSRYSTEHLADAFRIFNELSAQLSTSYQNLERQAAQLRQELAQARNERMQTLIEKERLANRLQRLLAALPAAVLVIDGAGRVVDCNQLAVSFIGEPLIGAAWSDVVQRALLPDPHNPHERRLPDNRRVNLLTQPLLDEPGYLVLLSDVTTIRDLQELVDQQKHLSAMGEMAASLAHQIRTPLATALLYASQLAHPEVPEDKRGKFASKLVERLRELERHVHDMLLYAKQGHLTMSDFSLASLLASLEENAMARLAAEGIVLQCQYEVGDCRLFGNENALRGALNNLIDNAATALAGTNRQGIIRITAQREPHAVTIQVADNGPGIDAAIQARIFEPFFTTRSQGTGLGLAVVASVAKAHGGGVHCQSAPGQGCVFTLHLPQAPAIPQVLPSGFSCRDGAPA